MGLSRTRVCLWSRRRISGRKSTFKDGQWFFFSLITFHEIGERSVRSSTGEKAIKLDFINNDNKYYH